MAYTFLLLRSESHWSLACLRRTAGHQNRVTEQEAPFRCVSQNGRLTARGVYHQS